MCTFDWEGFTLHDLVKDVEDTKEKSEIIQDHFRKNKIDINTKYDGYTCLHYACATGMSKLVINLAYDYKGKINIDTTSLYNETPLQLAVQAEKIHIVQFLLKIRANPNVHREGDGRTALHMCVEKKLVDILQMLLDEPSTEVDALDKENGTALHYSVQENAWYMVKLLLERGANPNARMKDGKTPLHCLVNGSDKAIVASLITYGADVNAMDQDHSTPLHIAVRTSNETAVKLFIENGANPDVSPDLIKKHVLHYAVEQENMQIFSIILAKTKNVDIRDGNSLTPLQKAVLKCDEQKVKLLLQRNANVNVKWEGRNETILLCSVQKGNINITNLLLQNQADISINVKSKIGLTPLIAAVENDRADYVKLLLEHGADVNAQDRAGNSSLHIACEMGNLEIVKLLSKSTELNVDAREMNNYTPMQLAFRSKNYEIVKQLLYLGANPNTRNPRTNNTPLHEAVFHNALDVVTTLLKGPEVDPNAQNAVLGNRTDVNIMFPGNKTLFHIAALEGNIELLELLVDFNQLDINALDDDQYSPLMLAIEHANEDSVKLLLDSGAFYDIIRLKIDKTLTKFFGSIRSGLKMYIIPIRRPEHELSILHFAVDRGNSKILDLIIKKDLEKPEKERLNLNILNFYKSTPIQIAVTKNDLEMAEILLKNGANPNIKDINDKCPYHYPLNATMMKLLMKYGAEVNTLDLDARTPLHLAVQRRDLDLVILLLKHGASPNGIDKWNNTPLHAAIQPAEKRVSPYLVVSIILDPISEKTITENPLLSSRESENSYAIIKHLLASEEIDVNCKDIFSRTPLIIAVEQNYLDVVKLLLEHKADATIVTETKGQSLLHIAAQLHNSCMLKELLEHGAHVHINSCDPQKFTPLMRAIKENDLMSVRVLLQYKCDVNVCYNNLSALDIASEKGNEDIIKVLLSAPGINIDTPCLDTPLISAVRQNKLDIIRILIQLGADPNKKGKDGRTPLHIAALEHNLEIIRFLLGIKSISVNAEDDFNLTPLHLAVRKPEVVEESVAYECIFILIVYGADPNHPCALGFTAVHLAAAAGLATFMDSIIKEQIGLISLPNKSGDTPLHLACEHLHHNIVKKILMVENAPVTQKNVKGQTPSDLYLYHLITNGTYDLRYITIEETIQDVAKKVIERYFRTSKITVEILLIFNKSMKWFDTQYLSTLLYFAVDREDIDLTLSLLKLGAKINYRTAIKLENIPDTTLSLAYCNKKILKILLEQEDCEINFLGRDSKTVLHYVVEDDKSDLDKIRTLLQYGAYPDAVDSQGRTPLFYTEDLSKIKLLLKFGAEPFLRDRSGTGPKVNLTNFHIEHLISRAAFKKGFLNDNTEFTLYKTSRYNTADHLMTQCLDNIPKCSSRIDEGLDEKLDEDITFSDILTENYAKIHKGNIEKIAKIVESDEPTNQIPWFAEFLRIKFYKMKQTLPIKTPIGKSGVTLSDFLKADPDQVAKYMEIKDVANFLSSNKVVQAKWFSQLINQKIQSGNKIFCMRRKILRNPHCDFLFPKLPVECREIILKQLGLKDLQELEKAIFF